MSHSSAVPPAAQELGVDIQRRDPAIVVRLTGSAYLDAFGSLRDRLVALIDEHTRQLVLDLTDLEFINSVGLGAIIAAHLRCHRYQGVVKIVAPRPAIHDLLSVTKLTHIFPVYPSVDAALASG